MCTRLSAVAVLAFGLLLTPLFSTNVFAQGNNTIEGRVTDSSGVSVYNAYIELYNDYELMIGRTRSSSQGRFSFRGLAPGRYTVRVKPFGAELQEDAQRVELATLSRSSTDVEYIEFRLSPVRSRAIPPITRKATVFAQEVDPEAKKKFTSGVERIQSGDEAAGVADLEAALKITPNYFDALSALGKQHVLKQKYREGAILLAKAIDVYKRCADCYYSLGLAFYKLDEYPSALRAAAASIALDPLAPESHLLNGILLRLSGEFVKAEAALLKAESLYKEPDPEVDWQLSLVYNKLNKNKEAADRLERYLKGSKNLDKKEQESIKELIKKLRNSKSS